MIRIFMVGMSTDKGGVEAYIRNLSGFLSDEKYEIVYAWPVMHIDGKIWECPENRHNYYKYVKFWKRFFKENHFDVIYYNACDIVSVDLLKFAKQAGVPVRIIHSHNTENQMKLNNFLIRTLNKSINTHIVLQVFTEFYKILCTKEQVYCWSFKLKT